MLKFIVSFLLLAVLAGAREPVTIEVASRPSSPKNAIGPVAWAEDGKRFAYIAGKTLWVYDAAKKRKRELGSLEPLEQAAKRQR